MFLALMFAANIHKTQLILHLCMTEAEIEAPTGKYADRRLEEKLLKMCFDLNTPGFPKFYS